MGNIDVKLKTYHGTNLSSAFDIWLHGIDLNKSLPNLDFGKGFYVTDSKEKAIERAYKKTNDFNKRYHCNEDPYLVELYIEDDIWKEINAKFFRPREKDWFYFVINNRMELSYLKQHNIYNHNKDNKYDMVFGEIADGKIADIANAIKNNKLTFNNINFADILPRYGKYYGDQYSFHTEKSLSCIKNISCAIIKERKLGGR